MRQHAVGALTLAQIDVLRPDIAFVGATAVHPRQGLFTTETSEAGVKAAILRVAKRKILVADASKSGLIAQVRFARFREIDQWINGRKK